MRNNSRFKRYKKINSRINKTIFACILFFGCVKTNRLLTQQEQQTQDMRTYVSYIKNKEISKNNQQYMKFILIKSNLYLNNHDQF